jgi:hypothetical protein
MVELYFEKELSDIVFEAESLEEWKSLAEELGISGQIELAKGTKSPIPFPYMNNKMKIVCETLCPAKVELKKYDKTPIPLEVLRQAKFALSENHFERIDVWYDDKSPDPFLVGTTGHWYGYITHNKQSIRAFDKYGNQNFKTKEELKAAKDYTISQYPGATISADHTDWFTEKDKYLIARWGDQLRDFKELTAIATERLVEEFTQQITAEISSLTQKVKRIKECVPLYISGNMTKNELTGSW